MPPILWFLHGLGSGRIAWGPVLAHPALSAFHCVADDLAGHGEQQDEFPASIESVADALAARLKAPGPPVVLVGHSLGGVIATLIAERPPERLVGFINVEGNLTLADCTISAAAAAAPNFDRWWEAFRSRMRRSDPDYSRTLDRTREHAFLALARDLVRLSTDAAIGQRYARLEVPKLFVHGDALPVESVRFVQTHRLAARHVAGAGHWLMGDRPAETADVIASAVRTWTDAGRIASPP